MRNFITILIIAGFVALWIFGCKSADRVEHYWSDYRNVPRSGEMTADSSLHKRVFWDDSTISTYRIALASNDTIFIGIYHVPHKFQKKFRVVIDTESVDILDWYLNPIHPLSPMNPASPGSPLYFD